VAATPIPANLLVAHAGDLPGFAGAKRQLFSTTSASEWARGRGNTEAEAKQETSELQQAGFQEAAEAFFTGRREGHRRREAVSDTWVLASAQVAMNWFNTIISRSLPSFQKEPGFKRSTVKAIPGSIGLGNFVSKRRSGAGNVFFTTGRCVFVVGDFVHRASTRAQVDRAPVAAAISIYRRAKGSCA
jgi:hypothetical protein